MDEPCTLKAALVAHLEGYRAHHTLSPHQSQVCRHILTCHTPALGSRTERRCDACDYHEPCYHSCRDRHCPSCQREASQAWCEHQRAAVLPVTYHHLVFTLPCALNGWVSLHPKLIYRLLFQQAWETLRGFGSDPKRLNGQVGMTAVLHTWGENLSRHVHLHALVPGGALTAQGQWHAASSTYLFPVRALSRGFRGRFVSALRRAAANGELHRVMRKGEVDAVLDELMGTDWVVFSKPCPNQAGAVIDYLGRYSHRIAISDARIVAVEEDRVRFRYKDYRHEAEQKVMALDGCEFIRRFLQHVLPKGLMRIRHYGLLANRCRKRNLTRVCLALNAPLEEDNAARTPAAALPRPAGRCPRCRRGRLVVQPMTTSSLKET